MMQIQGPPGGGMRQLHIAYHNGDHYLLLTVCVDDADSGASWWGGGGGEGETAAHSVPQWRPLLVVDSVCG